ncbi:ESCRT-II complex vps25 subunit [Carpediemonas membranifera]|uniref:Vacuolar protein-sorting-associated protein 25 n=1 Tax=Carpediemonas membranifera TaxID=201153 RepID=A0A8J6B802_9EUKA|nr:ESCRT-II complex vps25 subunit [Carpediemonas membranifera]QNO39397.1 vacuolar protein sorting 25 [Carpediemonas membranifera]|eukprot:KAG9396154.1 ESCRT-II complex vps25 subunit [Carpediemonas membranifera]
MSFSFPSYHNLPPFYTLQPNLETQTKQLEMWGSLVQSYCRFNKITHFPVGDMLSNDLFHNKSISRQVTIDMARAIIDFMVSHGTAQWEGKEKLRATIVLRTLDDWADIIYNWAYRVGNVGTVVTAFELLESDESKNEEFYKMDRALFRRVMGVLEKQGKARLFNAGDESKEGVKFVEK